MSGRRGRGARAATAAPAGRLRALSALAVLLPALLLVVGAAAGPATAAPPRPSPAQPLAQPPVQPPSPPQPEFAPPEALPRPPRSTGDEALRTLLLRAGQSRRLVEVDRLLELGSLDAAAAVLDELERDGQVQPRDLLPRRARLAALRGQHAEAAALARQALALDPGNVRLLRELATSLAALDSLPAARQAVARLRARVPDPRSAVTLAVELWREAGRPAEALAVCDSARLALREPLLLSRQRAACLLALARPGQAADELVAGLRDNPLDLPLVRTELLDSLVTPAAAAAVRERLTAHLDEPAAGPAERLLLADLQLSQADAPAAVAAVRPLLSDPAGRRGLLQAASVLVVEAPLLPEGPRRRAASEYLLTVLGQMARDGSGGTQRLRVLDMLARVAEDALSGGWLQQDPERAVARLEEVLSLVRQGNPTSAHLYSAQIRLSRYLRDELGRPQEAAARLEALLADLDLPLEGVALARLALGECYLAAGDTARARTVLTHLGRSQEFRAAAGHAHYHLARLDLAEGHWETARDRFAAVALDAPEADYANDALDLALAVAEELDNPTGGPDLLAMYGRAVRWDLAARPDSQVVALQQYVAAAVARVDLSTPQPLLERGRFELARLLHRQGRDEEALAQCERILLDHPDGRYPADALRLAGRIHAGRGEVAEARRAWERLLLQYPDHLFADEVRESLRGLGEALP